MTHRASSQWMRAAALIVFGACLSLTATADRKSEKADRAAQASDPDKVVCKRIKETGTHFKRKVCHTQRVWDAQKKAAQEAAQRLNQNSTSGAEGIASGSGG